ncbi:hypothetical protein [Nocardia pseudovaccinii]|uniref:hypothetical protein n=1 Tax=Nocardia pseudovaccinii TaxID=189540 RepID=UPI0012F4CB2D|nr:hypothetical protein [Nocardia pseudovaccinii]
MAEVVPSRPNAIAPSVRKLLAEFHEETLFKLDLAPADSAPVYQGADGSLSLMDEDGWVSDSDAELDKADAIPITPRNVVDHEMP